MKQKIKRLMSIIVASALILSAALPAQVRAAGTEGEDMPPQYHLKIEQSEGGILKAEPEKEAYTPGEEIGLTVEVQDGYMLSQIQSDPQQDIKLDELKVRMPDRELLLEPVFEKVVETAELSEEPKNNEAVEETADASMVESGSQQDAAAEEHEKLLISPKLPAMLTTLANRAVGIAYNGEVTYKGTTVGAFTVNGNIAFCMEHMKPTPNTGASFYEQIYNNADIRKVLYYGWAGPGQWSGFTSYEQGVVCTSLALSYYYSGPGSIGGDPFLGDNWMSPLGDFIRYCESQSTPDNLVSLSKTYVESFLSSDKKYQMTEDIVFEADSKNTVTFPLS